MTSTRTERLRFILRTVQVRLRFPLALLALFFLLGQWDRLREGTARLLSAWQSSGEESAVSPDTEYFCPMCPGVQTNWPAKCPVCNMPLVRREKSAARLLPEGVTARMQFSPYRLQLAGVRTTPAEPLPLHWGWLESGVVESVGQGVTVSVVVAGAERDWVREGAEVEVHLAPAVTALGTVSSVAPTERPESVLALVALPQTTPAEAGSIVSVRFQVPVAELAPFDAQPRDPPPLREGELRTVYFCPDHPQHLHSRGGKCPLDELPLEPLALTELQRAEYCCPRHPQWRVTNAEQHCEECTGEPLELRVVNYLPAGTVTAIPQSAVVADGEHDVVFVETGPGMFDGIAVTLGAACDGFVPVLSGVQPGQRVVTAGAFLLDAETRLNPALASSYFGASGASGLAPATDAAPTTEDPLAGLRLAAADLELARAQRDCPVTGLPLGSMGPLIRMEEAENTTFLCCSGCVRAYLRDHPDAQEAGTAGEEAVEDEARGDPAQ